MFTLNWNVVIIGHKQGTFRFLQRKQLPRSTAEFTVAVYSCSLFTLLAGRPAADLLVA